MTDKERAESLYDELIKAPSDDVRLMRIATQLSELIHCYKDKKVGDSFVLGILCAMRNAIWERD